MELLQWQRRFALFVRDVHDWNAPPLDFPIGN